MLANLYLHWFEIKFHRPDGPAGWARAKIVRYADDFVVLARYVGSRLRSWIETELEGRFRLTINREKTKVATLREPGGQLDFLGYTFRYDRDLHGRARRYLNLFPSKKSQARSREKVCALTSPARCFVPPSTVIGNLNAYLRGWANYFRLGYPRKAFRDLNWYVFQRMYRHLNRRSQRKFRSKPAEQSYYAYLRAKGLLAL